jgi:hypothetical protein
MAIEDDYPAMLWTKGQLSELSLDIGRRPELWLSAMTDISEQASDCQELQALGDALAILSTIDGWGLVVANALRTNRKLAGALTWTWPSLNGAAVLQLVGVDAVAIACCRWFEEQSSFDLWGFGVMVQVISQGQGDIDTAWELCLALVEKSPNDKVLGNVGSSAIEDLFDRDPERASQLVEIELPKNPRLRRAGGWKPGAVGEQ